MDQRVANNDSANNDLPGGELPVAVYRTVLAAYVWMMLAAWIAFGAHATADINLGIATVVMVVFTAIPCLIYVTATHHKSAGQESTQHFVSSQLDTATGWLSGREAWLQIAIIPLALAVAATAFGAVYVLAG